MTTIASWNIQTGLGVDGRVDLRRIADTISSLADADVICLQEVSSLKGAERKNDQFGALRDLFPGYMAIEGPGIEMASADGIYRFGNMVLSRLPVLSVFRHHLPWPIAPDVKHMPRQATEVSVATPAGPLRIVTTHLEFHAQSHRQAQITRIRELHAEATAQVRHASKVEKSGPYAPFDRPITSVICGDFNMKVGSKEYGAMLAPFDDDTPGLIDGWSTLYPDLPHDPTCGVFDDRQWPEGAHCRDFFFVTEDLSPYLASLAVDKLTDASDHQPLVLVIDHAVAGGSSA